MPISEVAGASKEAVNHPSHYAAHYRREVVELTSRFKGRPTEDLQKAHWYLNYFSDHPESGFLKSEGLEPVLADFLTDLANQKDQLFGEEAGRFVRNLVAAVQLAPEFRAPELEAAKTALETLIKASEA